MLVHKKTILFLFFSIAALSLTAQSPFRIFTLDCNLNTESERLTASLVTKSFLLNHVAFVKESNKVKPYVSINWSDFQKVIDSLHAKLPADGSISWEEDYGLKAPPAPKHEKWKEITFYYTAFEQNGDLKAIVKGKRTYILQIRVEIDLNGQIAAIKYLKGKEMKNRDVFILHAYKILYKK
jgi:hypothetical protein